MPGGRREEGGMRRESGLHRAQSAGRRVKQRVEKGYYSDRTPELKSAK